MDLHGWGEVADELNAMSREGGAAWARLGEVITDEMLNEFAVVAQPNGVAQALVDRFDGVVDPYIDPRIVAQNWSARQQEYVVTFLKEATASPTYPDMEQPALP
jgi:hypothetical protein